MTDQIKCPKCGGGTKCLTPTLLVLGIQDCIWRCLDCNKIFNVKDNECTCLEQCERPCKGTCGCKKCHDDYNDFLSVE